MKNLLTNNTKYIDNDIKETKLINTGDDKTWKIYIKN